MRSETDAPSSLAPDSKVLKPITLGPLPERPLVSVLITNYNYEKYVGEAIESVLAQTYQHFEIVVCDDGSTDGSCEVIDRFCKTDPRIRLVRQANGGHGSALNTAFSAARGDIIALLDGDDIALEKRLEFVIREFHRHPEAGIVTHALRFLNAQGRLGSRNPEEPLDYGWLAPALLHGPDPVFPPTSGICVRMEIAKRIFPLPWPRISLASWDWPIREAACFLTPLAAIDETLTLYRVHGNNMFGRCHLTSAKDIERRLREVSGSIEARRIYTSRFFGIEPDETLCNAAVGVLVLSHAALIGERKQTSEIVRYSRGKSRLIWLILFALPPSLTRRVYVWARESQIPMKGRWLKGHIHRLLRDLAAALGIRWEPGRRVRQSDSQAHEVHI